MSVADQEAHARATETLRRAGCVFAEDEAQLLLGAASGDAARLAELLERRCGGEPLELVVGFAEFAGLRIALTPGVFVPRQRSEDLVTYAVGLIRDAQADRRGRRIVVDLGTGSGALLAAVLQDVDAEAYAIDSSADAVACARTNLAHTDALVLTGTGLDALPARARGRVDVVVANLPYVPTHAIALLPREARLYEPPTALDGGPDGLAPLSAALEQASRWLAPSGHYLAEVHESQLEAVADLAVTYGLGLHVVLDPETSTAVADLTLGA